MVDEELQRLASRGVGEFPPARFGELALACRAAGVRQQRYLVLADAVELLHAAWEAFDAVWVETTDRLDNVLASDLPVVIAEPAEEAAVSLAESMREALALVLSTAPEM